MPWNSGRRTASSAVTTSAAWKRVRAVVLERDGHVCQLAGPACTVRATEVDKVLSAARGGLPEPGNCMAVCHACHVAKTAQDAALGRLSERRPAERHPGLL